MIPSKSERIDRYVSALIAGLLAAHADPKMQIPTPEGLAEGVFKYVDALLKERKKYEESIETK